MVFGVFSICHVVGSLCRRYDACEIENLENLSGWSCNPELTSDMVFACFCTLFHRFPVFERDADSDVKRRPHCGGQTPLHHAALNGRAATAERLIAAGAAVDADRRGRTAYDIAKERGHREVMGVLDPVPWHWKIELG